MAKSLRQVNVFIASPGDVSDFRDRVCKAVERVNRLVAKPFGLLLEPIGWEDIPAGKGTRTQDVINPYVDAADVFIGILNKRFGSPTGVAESGTEEEYLRIEKRWLEQDPKPQIMIHFRRLPPDVLADPGPQLQRLLAFKNRISDTVLYREFEGADDLGEKIENALADWIHTQRESTLFPSRSQDMDVLQRTDLEMLGTVLQNPDASRETLQSLGNRSADEIDSSIARLQRHGLVTEGDRTIKPANSTEGFLAIVKHLINSSHWRALLQSDYYSRMLNTNLRHLIATRFHCEIEAETTDRLRKLALLSPAVASYVLFGDTSLYDNLAEHARSLGDDGVSFANEMMEHNIVHNVLLRYAEDSTTARTLDTLEGRRIAGHLITIGVAAAYDEGPAIRALSKMPQMRVVAGTDIGKGQIVSGSPGVFLQFGNVLVHMGELELAAREFDKVLTSDNPPEVRATALNNKGLILLEREEVQEAIEAFREAVNLAPGLAEPRKNLAIARSRLACETPEG